MSEKILTLKLLKEKYGVSRLDKSDSLPNWAIHSNFFSITKTDDELSIVCEQNNIPDNIKCERDWRILKINGPLDFSLIGILSRISTLLAQKEISIFAISTYDTDYILVKNKDITDAIFALKESGYSVLD